MAQSAWATSENGRRAATAATNSAPGPIQQGLSMPVRPATDNGHQSQPHSESNGSLPLTSLQ